MNKEQIFDAIGQISDDVLVRHRQMDLRLSRMHTKKRHALRVLAVAACLALVLITCLPLAALTHPVGRAVLQGDSAALTEYLMGIDGFVAWQDQTAEKLEQRLPKPLWQMMQNTPILNVLTQSQFSGLTAQDSFADGKPYRLYFLSNGDGTCTLKYVTADPAFAENFEIEIPLNSPAGDMVTAIDIRQHTRVAYAQQADFPYVLTAAAMNELCKTAKANHMPGYDYNRLTQYYLKLSVENLDEHERQAMLCEFPIAAMGDIYVFDGNAGVAEMNKIYQYLTTYCEWDEAKYQQSVDEIVALAKRSEDREYAELCLTVLRHADMRQAVSISIPKTVTSINSGLWEALPGLETVNVAQDHPAFEVIDGCLVDTRTGTLRLYMREDGKFPEKADVRILDTYAFMLCRLQPEAEGELKQYSLHIPEGVTAIKDDCLTGLSSGGEDVVNIYLPASLNYFGAGAQDYPDSLIYHYPGTMEEWESDVAFGDMDEDSYIWLITANAAEPIIYRFTEK